MKFGDFLEEHHVPEWRSQYLDYSKGKTKLDTLASFLNTSAGCVCDPIEQETGSAFALHGGIVQTKDDIDKHYIYTGTTHVLGTSSKEGHEEDAEDEDAEDEDFRVVSLVDELNLPQTIKNTEITPLLSQTTKRARAMSTSFMYIKNCRDKKLKENPSITNIAKQQFIEWVDLELLKVDTFYKFKERECAKRLILLMDQISRLENLQLEVVNDDVQANECTHHPNKKNFFFCLLKNTFSFEDISKRISFIFDFFEMPQAPNYFWNKSDSSKADIQTHLIRDVNSPIIAKAMLKKAFGELYHKLDLLNSYKIVNRTAFRKLIKKYDKRCRDNMLCDYMEKVDGSYFNTSEVLSILAEYVENIYTEKFEDGHRKLAIAKLRSFQNVKSHYRSSFVSGILIGISLPLVVLFVSKIQKDAGLQNDKFVIQLWASWFLFVLAGLFFALNCLVWDKYHINYKLVFELNPNDALDYKQFLLIPSFFLFVGSIMSYFSYDTFLSKKMGFEYFNFIYFYFCLIILFCPLNIFYLKARIWFIVSLFRLFLSGFYPVEFRDFFMGVLTCSLTYSISNIYMVFCLQIVDWESCASCGPMKSYWLGMIACIPPLWRSAQCLRRFLDTGEWFPHFANLAKYMITTSYFGLLCLYRIKTFRDAVSVSTSTSLVSGILPPIFISVALINSIYSSFWDVCMDWSLMQISSENYLLRDVLIYKRKLLYYFAIIFDILLRFQWVVYVFTPYKISHSPITAFSVALAELLRRFVWMFFRMENEHASNMNAFRVCRVCPLPYNYTVKSIIENFKLSQFCETILHLRIADIFQKTSPSDINEIMEWEDSIENVTMSRDDLAAMLRETNASIDSDIGSIYSTGTQRTNVTRKSGWHHLSKIISRAHAKEFQQRNTDTENNIDEYGPLAESNVLPDSDIDAFTENND